MVKQFFHINLLNTLVTGKYYNCVYRSKNYSQWVVLFGIRQHSNYMFQQVFLVSFHSVSDFLMGDQDMVLSESTMSKQYSRVRRLFYV